MAEQVRGVRKFGIWLILLTVVFRLFELGLPQRLLRQIYEEYIQKETGQDARSLSVEAFFPFFIESPSLAAEEAALPIPVFSEADAWEIALVNSGWEHPELEALMASPLTLSLADGEPRVLILHTHTTESYTQNGEGYAESAAYRTLDEAYNMLSVGDRVAQILEEKGVGVIHDRQLHDYPSYTGAYTHARKSLQALLKEYPGVQLVLDLHRDASEGSVQLCTGVTLGKQTVSQLMLVLATGNASLANPNWQNNLAFAMKLQTVLEEQSPGICRPISLRAQRFNQDLGPLTVLVEVGAAGDSHDQALLAAEKLAQAILVLQNGSVTSPVAG